MKPKMLSIFYIIYLFIITAFSYHIIYDETVKEFEGNIFRDLKRLTTLTAEFVDKESIYSLLQSAKNNELPSIIENSQPFLTIQQQLIFVDKTYPNISNWSYIYYPTNEINTVIFLSYSDDDGMGFAQSYDISAFQKMIDSIKDKTQIFVEEEMTYDTEFSVWSTSAFAPIYYNDEYIGHVGIDMVDENFENNLYRIRINALLLAIAVVFIGGVLLPQLIYKFYIYLISDDFSAILKKRKLRRSIRKATRENK